MINKISADLIREYVLDHYVHYGFLPNDVEVEETIFDYKSLSHAWLMWSYTLQYKGHRHRARARDSSNKDACHKTGNTFCNMITW